MLGGATRSAVRVYNTCAGYRYVRAATGANIHNWGLPGAERGAGPYEDLDAFLNGRAGELAESLLAQGVTGMKMWPFDEYAFASGGLHISRAELHRGLEPFRQVRRAVGDRMDLMVELHGLWNLPTALKIAHAFEAEGLAPYWIEDPIRPDDIASLARFAHGTTLPTTASEMLGGRQAFRELLEARAASIVMLDLGWCGGLSEGKAVASMAEAFGLPGRAPRLHGAGGVDGQRAPLAQRPERPHPGNRAGVLHRLVHGARVGPAGRRERARSAWVAGSPGARGRAAPRAWSGAPRRRRPADGRVGPGSRPGDGPSPRRETVGDELERLERELDRADPAHDGAHRPGSPRLDRLPRAGAFAPDNDVEEPLLAPEVTRVAPRRERPTASSVSCHPTSSSAATATMVPERSRSRGPPAAGTRRSSRGCRSGRR